MKTTTLLSLLTLTALVACGPEDDTAVEDGTDTADTGAGDDTAADTAADTETAEADAELAADLAWVREEEKLARDVYGALGDQWGIQVFTNIGSSEQRHMDAIGTLLTTYGVADPIVDDSRGAFVNTDLAGYYTDLTTQGAASEVEALRAGAFIEEFDLADLNHLLSVHTEPDVRAAFESLACGSRNHLRAFDSQLQQRGADWTPQVMTPAEVEAVVSTAHESCN